MVPSNAFHSRKRYSSQHDTQGKERATRLTWCRGGMGVRMDGYLSAPRHSMDQAHSGQFGATGRSSSHGIDRLLIFVGYKFARWKQGIIRPMLRYVCIWDRRSPGSSRQNDILSAIEIRLLERERLRVSRRSGSSLTRNRQLMRQYSSHGPPAGEAKRRYDIEMIVQVCPFSHPRFP